MMCVICKHGETEPALITATLERGRSMLIFRSVPAEVCGNCGEQYVDAPIAKRLLEQAELAAQAGIEVEVRPYVAA
jgi:YgiT-type zinc finger domain-containing protein